MRFIALKKHTPKKVLTVLTVYPLTIKPLKRICDLFSFFFSRCFYATVTEAKTICTLVTNTQMNNYKLKIWDWELKIRKIFIIIKVIAWHNSKYFSHG
jgi:hypothetical protein